MRVAAIPETPFEWVVDRLGLVPRPIVDTLHGPASARCIMVAAKLGLFDELENTPRTAHEISTALDTNPSATEKLLNVLVSNKYLSFDGERYRLKQVARKWLLSSSPQSLRDNLMLRFLEWQAIEHFEEFVRTGQHLDVHGDMPAEFWGLYQRGMKSIARLSASELAKRTPMPAGATQMLDIGGSHGLYSVHLCRRHRELSSVILDLPQAIEHAAPLLAEEGMGDRVVHRPGNALTDDLGEEQWDLVFISQLLHHFTEEQNRSLLTRVARALRPGGMLACAEVLRQDISRNAEQTGIVLDIFFAATSLSGTWPATKLQGWQQAAGLNPQKVIALYTAPVSIVAATKPA